MDIPFFYHQNLHTSNHIELEEDASRHVVQVLRMQEGELLRLTNGRGNMAETRIVSAHKKKCVVEINNDILTVTRTSNIHIAISPIKNSNRLEWFLEKATEMGVAGIVPLMCQRTEKQHFRYDRMKSILVSAMLQSKQCWLPELQEPIAFSKFVTGTKASSRFIAHCARETDKISLTRTGPFGEAIILIGPEGDFTPEEIRIALDNHFVPVSLGETRLRTETAGMVAAALMINC